MPLHAHTAPPPALRAVLAALDSPLARNEDRETDDTSSRRRFADRREARRVSEPLPVHQLSSVSGDSPNARFTGWCFLLSDENGPIGTADTVPTAEGWELAHLSGGPYASSAQRCLRAAETLTAPYEPRMLAVPELYMMTLWLRCLGPAMDQDPLAPADLLVPLAPSPPGIAPEHPQRVDGLLPLLTRRLTAAPTRLLRTA